jgi:hypothetical protein
VEPLKEKIYALLNGGDLRSISGSNEVAMLIHSQNDFDVLFDFLNDSSRIIVMRAADSIEKVSRRHSVYLDKHKTALLGMIADATDKELKWHLAQLVPRLKLDDDEKNNAFEIFKRWLLNENESNIVRVNSIQALYELSYNSKSSKKSFDEILISIEKENIPSINARIRKLKLR